MTLEHHPDSNMLTRAIQRCMASAGRWSGTIFRSTGLDYATRNDVATGEGSRKAGGRWNPREGFRTVYGSSNLETALAETLAHSRYQGLPDMEALPLGFVALRIELQRVLDLTDGNVRRRLGISRKRMIEEPWRTIQDRCKEALTQAIGRLAREAGLEGVVVPSAVGAMGKDLVIFPDRLLPGSLLEIVHPERLPARRRRWS